MEQKRELPMEEMDKVSGGNGSPQKKRISYDECPSCGQPVAVNAGVTSGTCPHCGNAIPAKSPSNASHENIYNVRIL